jgi:hypothetical protein
MELRNFKPFKSAVNRWNYTSTPAARRRELSATLMPHIQSLHGMWIYPYGLEASKNDVYSEAREG